MASRLAAERRLEWEKLQSGDERFDWDIRPWLADCLRIQAEFRSIATGEDIVSRGDIDRLPAYALFQWLAYYGLYGDFLEQGEHKEKQLEDRIALGKSLHSKAPSRSNDHIVSKIIAVADARRKIERQDGVVEPQALAILGGVSEGRVRNLTAGASAEIGSLGGKIPAVEAGRWLEGRGAYWPSIWSNEQELEEESEMDTVRVPQASDGTVFHPGLRRRSGYMVGEKGNELTVKNYDAALKILEDMDVPRWRRPNSQGNWGIVKAIGWTAFSRRELNNIKD